MDKRIESVEQEPDGWWIYLKPGFRMVDGEHAIAEGTKRAALRRLTDVVLCDCAECQQLAAKV